MKAICLHTKLDTPSLSISPPRHSHEQLVNLAKLTAEDIAEVNHRRRPHNRLGFAYQMAFVRLAEKFMS
jgi:hypothetical protein